MTTYRFSDYAGGSLSFTPASDVLAFSTVGADPVLGGSAAQLQFTVSGSNLLVGLGGSTVSLTGVTYSQLISSSLSFDDGSLFRVGTAGTDSLSGGSGNDYLDGRAGADTLTGGAGNDVYIVDDVSETVTEASSAGTDTVRSSAAAYTLASNVENLVLESGATYGTGNASANTITGNSGNNTLNGAGGTDTLIGGTGNDFYHVDSIADVITENASEGSDSVAASVSYTLGTNVENLSLNTGAGNINATGNALDNTLSGNEGNNTINGGAGADMMYGSDGNDILVVDNAGDVVSGGDGTDTVQSSVGYVLGFDVENLTLTGSAFDGYGNSGDNILTGNTGANALYGQGGADTLIGGNGQDTLNCGSGADSFKFTAAGQTAAGATRDVIEDFSSAAGTRSTCR